MLLDYDVCAQMHNIPSYIYMYMRRGEKSAQSIKWVVFGHQSLQEQRAVAAGAVTTARDSLNQLSTQQSNERIVVIKNYYFLLTCGMFHGNRPQAAVGTLLRVILILL
jgi:hypothetical protein